MVHLAYDRKTLKILGFIITEEEINPNEVFGQFQNYEVIKTKLEPPFTGYTKYIVEFGENNEVIGYKMNEENKQEDNKVGE